MLEGNVRANREGLEVSADLDVSLPPVGRGSSKVAASDSGGDSTTHVSSKNRARTRMAWSGTGIVEGLTRSKVCLRGVCGRENAADAGGFGRTHRVADQISGILGADGPGEEIVALE